MPPHRKPWIKVDADADESDKLAGLPNHNARWGWFRMMCRAKTQRRMGVFAGQAHLKQLLGTEGRYVPAIVAAGLLHVWPTTCDRCARDYAGDATDGDLVVHDYRREQRDPTNAERQAGYRERNADGNGERNGSIPLSSRALSPSPSMSPSDNDDRAEYQVATPPEAHRLREVAEELTGIPNVLNNVWGGLGEKAIRLARKHGVPAVEREWRRIAADENGQPELRQLVLGSDDALNRVPRSGPAPKRDEVAELVARVRAEVPGA
ncbi:MAG TPA: hypothetical protein PK324_21235 [Nocardioides sp.]|nr:hypothetical protein [Nocardioides sp.]